jgi:hypothetical protein
MMKSSNIQTPSTRETPIPKLQAGRRTAFILFGHLKLGASLMLGFWCLALLFCQSSNAQTYSIDWYKIAGGGGTSTGGVYSVSGTIGQPDASGAMTGGSYSLTGGFWALYAVQTPGAPLLTIAHSGSQAIVSWPSSVSGWTLQTNLNLATGTWGNYTGNTSNNSATNSPPNGNLFFRLIQP